MGRIICNSNTHCESNSDETKSKLFPISLFILVMIIYAFIATKILVGNTTHADKESTLPGNAINVTQKKYF